MLAHEDVGQCATLGAGVSADDLAGDHGGDRIGQSQARGEAGGIGNVRVVASGEAVGDDALHASWHGLAVQRPDQRVIGHRSAAGVGIEERGPGDGREGLGCFEAREMVDDRRDHVIAAAREDLDHGLEDRWVVVGLQFFQARGTEVLGSLVAEVGVSQAAEFGLQLLLSDVIILE